MQNYYEKSILIQNNLVSAMNTFIKNKDKNKLIIKTNLECGIPTKDIHKIAGPLLDEWVFEKLKSISRDNSNDWGIMDVISKDSSSLEDIAIKIKLNNIIYNVLIDVKTASLEKGDNAGKGSNLTSYRKIRPHYASNPNSIFLILSIKHNAYFFKGKREGLEILGCNLFDLKLVKESELKLNTSMGDQFQISNSMNVNQVNRTTDDFIKLLDSYYSKAYSESELQARLEEFRIADEFNKNLNSALSIINSCTTNFTKASLKKSLKLDDKIINKIFERLKKENIIETAGKKGYYKLSNKKNTN